MNCLIKTGPTTTFYFYNELFDLERSLFQLLELTLTNKLLLGQIELY